MRHRDVHALGLLLAASLVLAACGQGGPGRPAEAGGGIPIGGADEGTREATMRKPMTMTRRTQRARVAARPATTPPTKTR